MQVGIWREFHKERGGASLAFTCVPACGGRGASSLCRAPGDGAPRAQQRKGGEQSSAMVPHCSVSRRRPCPATVTGVRCTLFCGRGGQTGRNAMHTSGPFWAAESAARFAPSIQCPNAQQRSRAHGAGGRRASARHGRATIPGRRRLSGPFCRGCPAMAWFTAARREILRVPTWP